MRYLAKLLVLTCLLLSGCDAETRTRLAARPDYRMVPHHVVEAPQAQSAEMYFRMKKGKMQLGGNANALLVSKHAYKSPVRAPILEFQEVEEKAYLALSQETIPSIGIFGYGDSMNEWDVQLNPKIPLDLTVEFGKGTGDLNLNQLNLERLRIYNHEGNLSIDLTTKNLQQDLSIWMNNLDGDIHLKLPPNTGAHVTTVRGAEITAESFQKDKAIYTNDHFENARNRIFVDVHSLSGKVIIQ